MSRSGVRFPTSAYLIRGGKAAYVRADPLDRCLLLPNVSPESPSRAHAEVTPLAFGYQFSRSAVVARRRGGSVLAKGEEDHVDHRGHHHDAGHGHNPPRHSEHGCGRATSYIGNLGRRR
jgi:hypothetical protein